jgi:hypothetical protein
MVGSTTTDGTGNCTYLVRHQPSRAVPKVNCTWAVGRGPQGKVPKLSTRGNRAGMRNSNTT